MTLSGSAANDQDFDGGSVAVSGSLGYFMTKELEIGVRQALNWSDAVGGGGTTRTGFGIGLSLVRDTVERFGGTASVVETSPSGTTIELRIPQAREL